VGFFQVDERLLYKNYVAEVKYFGKTITNQHAVHGEIKSRLRFGIACYHQV
jgi:hypothetical protein